MSSGAIGGMNFGLYNGIIDFFGERGIVQADGTWVYNLARHELPALEASRANMLPVVGQCIQQDIAEGNGDKLAMVLVGPWQARALFMQGVIRPEHLTTATEPTTNAVDIPGVTFGQYTLTVRVMDDPSLRVATADATGQII